MLATEGGMTNRLAVLAVKLLWYGKRFFEVEELDILVF